MNRTFSGLLRKLTLATLMVTSLSAAAGDWPSKPLTLIVPFPPGGGADTIGRYYAEQLSTALGQPVVVDNKPGAGTAIAAEAAAKAKPDGYTLSLATTGQLTILPNLADNLRFDPVKSFTPVSVLASIPNVVAVNSKLGVKDLQGLIAEAKKRPGEISYSSCGNGTLCHLTGELFKSLAGVDLLHIPYKGSAPAITALLGGEVDVAVDTLTILVPQIQAGKVQGLAIAGKERSPLIPDVPTAAEAGLQGLETSGWFGLVLPANAPAEMVQRLNQEVGKIAQLPETAERFAQNGIVVEHTSPEQFSQIIKDDLKHWGEVAKASGAQIE
ncbi:Bug family tripartite tricarboxylate transporter substrate binding protein [Pseudomonas sp. TTU2014-080ASC]|uniref:Bug family tripartite tricarboxylate transporter substrate binding protein n=1 Tax=Pseudomonas sp. TTU2014-080ASC TaxID=1729724 RepID=UPI00071856EC|nr:tripartite tricarboxylate transporter substrate binding protein [Pseudomonas sp. TTU2014-080ASC]KRW62088.1 ABC transporter substrate-binding protein [Pseudomonas sp. TTU2014-080ASC]